MTQDENEVDLGHMDICLPVENVAVSRAFYLKLGFQQVQGSLDEGWVILKRRDCRFGLYAKRHINEVMFNFRGGDVLAIEQDLTTKGLTMQTPAKEADDGCVSATLRDPDGNCIFFDTAPGETPDFD